MKEMKKVAPEKEWIIDSEKEMGLFIMGISNKFKMKRISFRKRFVRGDSRGSRERTCLLEKYR